MNLIETTDAITEKAKKAVVSQGGNVDEEDIVLVSFPEGSEQIGEGEWALPDGSIIGSRGGEDLGAFWEHSSPTEFYLKKGERKE